MRKLFLSFVAVAALSISMVQFAEAAAVQPAPVVVGSGSKVVVPWIFIGCAGGIILAAFHANYRDNRELTAPEAWTCGLLHWFSQPREMRRLRRP
jgi:hypothetical protein